MSELGQIIELRRHRGLAGQLSFSVHVRFSSGVHPVGFAGSIYGSPGPIIMFMGRTQIIVDQPERFGEKFDEDWVRAFYASDPAANHEFSHRTEATCFNCGNPILRSRPRAPWYHEADGEGNLSIWCPGGIDRLAAPAAIL